MLQILFLLAAAALVASWLRPANAPWRRPAIAVAALVLLVVLVALGVEFAMQTPAG